MKTIIERGASWTLEETKLLLALWGQDLVQRQQTNLKRTKEVYEKIAEKFNHNGFERTPDQVRTRVFNMIAEYRRILKDPSEERKKKCIFFDALHKIYQAKHMDDIRSALDDYEPDCPYSPASNTIMSERGDESISDSEGALVVDGEAQSSAVNRSKSLSTINKQLNSTSVSNSVQAINSVTNSNDTPTKANHSSNIDLQDASHAVPHDGNADSSNIASAQSAGNTISSGQDGDSSVKHFKIRTPNNEVMLLKVVDGELPSVSKKLRLEPYKLCSCEHAAEGKHNSKTCTSNNHTTNNTTSTPISRHQSLLLPHTSIAGPSSLAASSANTSLTAKPGTSNNTYISINNAKIPIVRSNGVGETSSTNNITSTPARLQPPTATVASHHQLYQAPINTFDVTSSALLIDRMFAHLSRESENMREWIALEKERLALERAKKAQETEREIRRERVLIDTLMRFQEQWISFISRLDPKIVENASEPIPELKFPPASLSNNTSSKELANSADKNVTGPASKTTTTINPSGTSTSTSSSNDTSLTLSSNSSQQ